VTPSSPPSLLKGTASQDTNFRFQPEKAPRRSADYTLSTPDVSLIHEGRQLYLAVDPGFKENLLMSFTTASEQRYWPVLNVINVSIVKGFLGKLPTRRW
jgi:hypothetical protein